MSSTLQGWANEATANAKAANPSVTDAVSRKMELLLFGRLSAHQLSPKDLKELASELIGDMLPAAPKPEEK